MRNRTCVFDSRTWTERQYLTLMRRMAVHGFTVCLACKGGANGAEFGWIARVACRGFDTECSASSAWTALADAAGLAERARKPKASLEVMTHEHKASA